VDAGQSTNMTVFFSAFACLVALRYRLEGFPMLTLIWMFLDVVAWVARLGLWRWFVAFWRGVFGCFCDPNLGRKGGFRRITPSPARRTRAKPAWVLRELIRLKALMPSAGCRTISITFNRLFANKKMSVCKSAVNELLRGYAHAILMARRDIRNQKPKLCEINDTWGLDITGRADTVGEVHSILGIIDHGSRRLISLQLIQLKSSWQLLSWLCLAIEKYGNLRSIRTDNEHCCTSKVFRFGSQILRIRHQKTDKGCPWQNGRIERFFGTLK
jgi:putative transposase